MVRNTFLNRLLAGAIFTSAILVWQPAQAEDDKLQALIKELNTLLDKGEQQKLADPWFLKDLRKAIQAYEFPWSQVLLDESFKDGNFDRNPTWTVNSGDWQVGWNGRLRSQFTAPVETRQNTQNQDPAAVLVGTILQQVLKQQGGSNQEQAPKSPNMAKISTALNIPNTFAVAFETYAAAEWKGAQRLSIGTYQNNSASDGYRLTYVKNGGVTGLEITRVSSRGSAVIDGADNVPALDDGKQHRIEWMRYNDATMVVTIDGTEVLRTRDAGFRDAFNGFTIENHGGDFTVARVVVFGE